VACYLAYALNQLELRAQLLDGLGGMLNEFAHGIGKRDVLLVASFRNYTPAVVETALACRARGVAVVAITDSALSPLKPAADVCFELGDDSSRPFRSLVAPLCLAQALVVSTGQRLAAPAKRAKKSGRGGASAGGGR
jgi:DNA-binding MurR/RpiR family transcriptional regulator